MEAMVEASVCMPEEAVVAAVVQMNAGEDEKANMEKAEALIREAAAAGARIVGLPENFSYTGPWTAERMSSVDEPIPGPRTERLGALSAELGIYLVAGSMPERVQTPAGPVRYNTSVLLDPQGRLVARYRKMHMFDVEIPGQVSAKESDLYAAGDTPVVADTAYGRMGLTICYDVRFGELYRHLAQQKAWCLWVPANFTLYTGKDHWETLLRARAVENQTYVLAPAQIGLYQGSRGESRAFGSAMIVDPWGTVIARMPEEEGFVAARLDPDRVRKVRTILPSWSHHRPPALYETPGEPQPAG